MAEVAQPFILITTLMGAFEAHECAVPAAAVPNARECDVSAVAVFPDRRYMVTGLGDNTLCLWDLRTGVMLKKMKGHRTWVGAVAISRDRKLIASGDANGELIVWDGNTGESLTKPIKIHSKQIASLDFSPDGTTLASGSWDTTTELWTTQTWQAQGDPINCSDYVHCVRHSPDGEHLAIATSKDVEIWNTGNRECIARLQSHNPAWNYSLAWTPDGKRLLSSSNPHPTIWEWDTATWQQVDDPWKGYTVADAISEDPTGSCVASASTDHPQLQQLSDRRTITIFKRSDSKILAMNMATRNACIDGDLHTAEALLTQQIDANKNDYNAYANRSIVRARKADWDCALDDSLKSISIQHSLIGLISKGIALCGKMQVQDAMEAFDLASMFTNEYSKTSHLLLLIKAIAYFNVNLHEHAILRCQNLANVCPKADTPVCHIVEAYLRFQLGMNAFDGAYHNEAADHFTAMVNTIALTSQSAIHSKYEDFVMLFGWDLKKLWQIANRTRCDALLHAGKLREAHESYRYMMDTSDEATKASCLDWSNAFKQKCRALYAADGDAALVASGDDALAAGDYDKAIELYSVAIDLDFATETIFANRSRAKLGKMLWEDVLFDAEKIIELNPSSYIGYQLRHQGLRGAQRYDEAIEAFKIMLSKLENAPDTQTQSLRRQYITPSKAENAIQEVIKAQLDDTPHRLLDTLTGRLCDREVQVDVFKTSTEYKELLLSAVSHGDLRMGHIRDVVATYFRYVMLSHRWEGTELLLYDIQGNAVYDLNPVGSIMKLQSFCKTARDMGYRWTWVDTCCIDRTNNVETQRSVNSMFAWYRRSALTIVYLSDVPPSSKPGALASSVWNTRGWTVLEFLAPQIILFYQADWTPYLADCSPNHKDSPVIMQEMGYAMGIDAQALVAFRPGMRDAREKLQWASTRVTTRQEDVAYSLFGIFDVALPVIYGERKQRALGRLLQEIVAQSGDITTLNWVGTSSDFNSCLPADIISYAAPPCLLPSLSEDEIQTSVSSLQATMVVELALKLYNSLDCLSSPRFYNCRLYLPCIAFRLTEVKRGRGITYRVKADRLRNLLITTRETLTQFSRAKPTQQSFFLVRPWDRRLLELPDFSDDPQSTDDWSKAESLSSRSSSISSGEQCLVRSESHSQALRLLVCLGQPFAAFLLARQHAGEYRRIASDHNIIAQVKDVTSVHDVDVRIFEIL